MFYRMGATMGFYAALQEQIRLRGPESVANLLSEACKDAATKYASTPNDKLFLDALPVAVDAAYHGRALTGGNHLPL